MIGEDTDQFIDSLMNIKFDKSICYKKNVHNVVKYQCEMNRMMIAVKNQEKFKIASIMIMKFNMP